MPRWREARTRRCSDEHSVANNICESASASSVGNADKATPMTPNIQPFNLLQPSKWRDQISVRFASRTSYSRIARVRSPTSSVSLSAAMSVSRIVYQAVIPPSGASENLGKDGSGIWFSIHRLGRLGSRTSARASPTTSTTPLRTASSACARVLKPPVSIRGLEVLVLARLANSIKYGPRPTPSEAAFASGK